VVKLFFAPFAGFARQNHFRMVLLPSPKTQLAFAIGKFWSRPMETAKSHSFRLILSFDRYNDSLPKQRSRPHARSVQIDRDRERTRQSFPRASAFLNCNAVF
jgi:hypothetical protein